MALSLTLTIENEKTLPDGGPLSFRLTGARGADIGRDSHLDWTLPDPSRFISGKHCEIRFREGGYWLSDVSTNGTFLNDADRRMQSPYRLRDGDRLAIGHYFVTVAIEGAAVAAAPKDVAMPDLGQHDDVWGSIEGAAPPIDPRDLRPAVQSAPVKPDFLEWAVDVPNAPGVGFVARPVAAQAPGPAEPPPAAEPLDWMAGDLPVAPPPEAPPPVPTPRRSIWINPGPAGPWDAAQAPPPPAEPSAPPPAAPDRPPPPEPEIRGGVAPDVIRSFARGAGVPPESLAAKDANAFAEHLGRLMRLVADNLKQLLAARSQTKRAVRSAHITMIDALNNNPLKFSPSGTEALRIIFGPPSGSYLDADKALQQSFDDLKTHQIKTFAAMQSALQRLVEDLDPKALNESLGRNQGLAGVLGSRKARLWDLYETRWKAKGSGPDGGLLELYLNYFADAYDREQNLGPKS